MSGSEYLVLIHQSCTGLAVPLRNERDYSRLRHLGVRARSTSEDTEWIVMGALSPLCWWTVEFLRRTSSAQDSANRMATHDDVRTWIDEAQTVAERDRRKAMAYTFMYDTKIKP